MLGSKISSAMVAALLVVGCATPIGSADAGGADASLLIDAPVPVDARPPTDAATPPDAGVPTTRPIAPLSTATVTSRDPTLHWSLTPGSEGAHVELCRDRACTMVFTSFDVTGTSATTGGLPTGVVYWRFFSRTGGTTSTVPSPTWQFTVGALTAPVDTSWGTTLDVNGDGYADLAVGAFQAASLAGAAYVYLGSASGLGTTPATSLTGPDGVGGQGGFGVSVASAGDVNGDGYADLAVGANTASSLDTGRVYVYLGSASGLGITPATSLTGPDGPGGSFGYSVASAGDVNGDGYADVVVGAPNTSSDAGRVYVYLGSASGLGTTPVTTLDGPDGASGAFGTSVASVGDVNGDGYGDVAIGASAVASATGRAYLYLGSAWGLGTSPATSLTGPDGPNGIFGQSVASAGDVDGDGYADLAVGAPGAGDTGRAHVYFGGASGLRTMPHASFAGPDGPGDGFGWSVASAGDVNGDGYADLAVGSPNTYSNTGRAYVYLGRPSGLDSTAAVSLAGPDGPGGGFGLPVANAGDVNGDGFPDIAVGAEGVASGGRAYVYFGRAPGVGLGTTPGASLTGPDGAGDGFGVSIY